MSFSCHVECDPLCDVSWSFNDVTFVDGDLGVTITEEIIPENSETFSSVLSTLTLSQEALDDVIDDIDTNLTISCKSSINDFGSSVSSSTSLSIECRSF